ncbi:MAG: glycoside hydrolase family 15 protein [Chloroflexi bacterium]|nr:glycoside hydrolase family 15 protein [Chloroflexota bacterium]
MNLHKHSLQVILDNQQPGGGYLACPTMPDYQYSWFRDGAYIAYGLTLDGQDLGAQYNGSMAAQWDSAGRFHSWCAGVIHAREAQIERSIARAARGEAPDVRDVLNARYRADGSEGPDDWPEFQLDGVGTWLWSVREYARAVRVTPLPAAWAQAVELAARYLAALWRTPCYDCWEERGSDIHISTLGAIYAGLGAAHELLPELDFEATRQAIKAYVLDCGLTPGGELAKSVGLDMVDANLISAAVPHGLFAPDDPIMRRTIARIERELHAPGSGVHRHLEDTYYGGGAWVLLALWLAWYYAETGETDLARDLLAWAESQADAEGNLPEQVFPPGLEPAHYEPWIQRRGPIACPLLWTHAKYLIVRRRLAHVAAGDR